VVNGLGGSVIYPFDETSRPESRARFNEDFGALLVEGTGEHLHLRFVTRQGQEVDRLLIESR
jgi:hypothetical protein